MKMYINVYFLLMQFSVIFHIIHIGLLNVNKLYHNNRDKVCGSECIGV